MDCPAKELLETICTYVQNRIGEAQRRETGLSPASLLPIQCWFWAGTRVGIQMSDNIFRAKVYKSPVAGGCEDSWTNSLGVLGPVSCQDLVPSWGRGWSAKGSGSGMMGPYKHPPSLNLCPSLPREKSSFLSAWPALSQAKSGRGSDGRSETGLWLAPGIIRLVRRLPISLPAHSELLDGIAPMAK